MHPRLFPPPRLLQFAGVIIFLVSLPKSYSRCDRTFNCGSVTGIGYPFWGNGRPDYCGIPEFELKCLQDGSSEMEIMSQTYRVLGIDQSQRIIRIVRLDLWDGACPEQLLNTTLNFTFFHYAAGNVNLTLFYGCSSPNSSSPSSSLMEIRATNQFSCPVRGAANEAISDAYVVISGSTLSVRKQNTPSCNQSIIVPVLETADGRFGSHGVILGALLRRGFNVQYAAYDTMCSQCVDSGGRCGYNSKPTCFCRNPPYLLLPPDPLTCDAGPKSNFSKKIAIASSILGFFTIVGVMLLLYYLRKKFSTGSSMGFWKRRTKNAQNMEAFLNTFGSLAPKKYSYKEIKKMTNSFKHKLGQGGYGGVFKGILLDGSMVAVKVSTETKGNGEEFINEVASICRTSHVNIVRLLGFCFDGSKRALIYEFMPNGSLEKFIHMEKPLTHPHLGWERLYQIAVGIAQGLEYLHRGCSTRIMHFDIKPHNILLDQDFCPKISDFGLAKLCPRKESIISMAGARGTAGYIAPEVFCRNFGGVSHKSDVYSYGMMILEMVGGRKNIDVGVGNTSEIYFPHWIYKRLELDEDLRLHGVITSEEEEIARKMILVGLWCIQTDPSNRPSMSKVVDMLEGSLESLEIPPKPFLSPPPRSPVQSSITSMSQKQCI